MTLTLKVFCVNNLFVLEGIVMILIRTKHSDNMTTYYGQMNLIMRNKNDILSQFLVSVSLTLTINRYFMK